MTRVYLDNAATTRVRPEVVEAMTIAFTEQYGNCSSMYQEGESAKALLDDARSRIAASLNAEAREIYFTSCGSEADNWALKGAALKYGDKKKKILISAIEHHAILHTCDSLAKQGFEIVKIPVDAEGIVDVDFIKSQLDDNTLIVSVMLANNEIGTIQPIKEIAALCKEKKILCHTDAVQAVGSIPVDVKDLGVDMLSLSGHKFHSPKGIGALYIRKGVTISNFMDGGHQERGKRAGTENLPYILGMAKALELAVAEMNTNLEKITDMRDSLIKEIEATIPYCKFNGHRTKRLPGNVNFSFNFIEGESMLLWLDDAGFACSTGSACASGSLDPSHVLLAIGLPHEVAHGSLRISIGKFNTKEEVMSLVPVLAGIVQKLRDMSPLYEDFMNGRELQQGTCPRCNDDGSCKI
ncbi:MAG: cysteine desulfurase NifS [Clostridia bacterium]|nr:cysteine desulfurase NifS [Clostridia bacterium]